MQRLTLIRHGESEWNRDGIIQGFSECDLSDLGRAQCARLRERLDAVAFDAAYTSSASRAVQTAEIALGHRMRVEARPNLREINLGVWEGRRAVDLKREMPRDTSMWFQTPSKVCIDGAEPLRVFRRRIMREINRIRGAHPNEGVVIIAHGGVICNFLAGLLRLKLDDMWRFKIHNASISRIIFPEGEPRIDVLNDVSHLSDAMRVVPNAPPKNLL